MSLPFVLTWAFRLLIALFVIWMPLRGTVTPFLAGRRGPLLFAVPFVYLGSAFLLSSYAGGLYALVAYAGAVLLAEWAFRRLDDWREIRATVREAYEENEGRRVEVKLGPFRYTTEPVVRSNSAGIRSADRSVGRGGCDGFSGGGGASGSGGTSEGW